MGIPDDPVGASGLRSELLHERLISLSNDTLAVVDMAEKSKGVQLLRTPTHAT